jgi:uncharacterized protein YacL
MSANFISRILGMVVFAFLLGWGGTAIAGAVGGSLLVFQVLFGLVGALFGLIFTPYLTVVPVRRLRSAVKKIPIHRLFAVMIGLVIGLIIAALAALPLSLLPDPFGQFLPMMGAMFFGYAGVAIMSFRQADVVNFLRPRAGALLIRSSGDDRLLRGDGVLLDTSVIIDGRIADISRTGFICGPLIVPHFVLSELQHVADSSERLRRNRGRRGLELLNRLQKDSLVPIQITDMDVEGVHDVDDKLVVLAKQLRCPVITNDYNLNRVAELQGVTVLNINELANAVRAVHLPGEELAIRVIQEGKERGQGVGYLDDGTMVVVENGADRIDKTVETVVTKVLQTAAGRMIFARLAGQ